MEGSQERGEPLDRVHDLSSLSGEVEAVAEGDRSMQQCPSDNESEARQATSALEPRSLQQPSTWSTAFSMRLLA